MITVAMWFFLGCGLFSVASAMALHHGAHVPRFMSGRSAFGQLCQGTAALFLAELCATSSATPMTWVMVGLTPILMTIGLRADHAARRRVHAESP